MVLKKKFLKFYHIKIHEDYQIEKITKNIAKSV